MVEQGKDKQVFIVHPTAELYEYDIDQISLRIR